MYTINQAKTIVAKHLNKLGVKADLIYSTIDMTKDECILETANLIEYKKGEFPLEEIKLFVYMPEHLFI